MLFTGSPSTLGMQGGDEPVLAETYIERVGVGLARIAEVEICGNSHWISRREEYRAVERCACVFHGMGERRAPSYVLGPCARRMVTAMRAPTSRCIDAGPSRSTTQNDPDTCRAAPASGVATRCRSIHRKRISDRSGRRQCGRCDGGLGSDRRRWARCDHRAWVDRRAASRDKSVHENANRRRTGSPAPKGGRERPNFGRGIRRRRRFWSMNERVTRVDVDS